jgi:hypothetical protein
MDVRAMAGGGASGGLGAGLFAFLGARLHPRNDVMMEYMELDELLAGADLVLTAEGRHRPPDAARQGPRRGGGPRGRARSTRSSRGRRRSTTPSTMRRGCSATAPSA